MTVFVLMRMVQNVLHSNMKLQVLQMGLSIGQQATSILTDDADDQNPFREYATQQSWSMADACLPSYRTKSGAICAMGIKLGLVKVP